MHIITFQGFKDELSAEIARLELLKMQHKGRLELVEAVIIAKSPTGEINLKQAFSFTPNATIVASWLGTLIGACIGIPFGPLGPLIGTLTGVSLGTLIGVLTDAIEIQELKSELTDTLKTGNSAALFIVADETNAPKVFDMLRKLDAKGSIVQKALSKKIEEQLKAIESELMSK